MRQSKNLISLEMKKNFAFTRRLVGAQFFLVFYVDDILLIEVVSQ